LTLEDSAFAKINLGLRILGRRPDGFHDIRSVFHTVSLHDTVRIGAEPGIGRVLLRTSGIEIPCEEGENLASRAARLFLHEIGLSLDVEIEIEKRIPVGSGLGGGSSDAASVLRLLRRASGMDPGIDEIAPRLGSDVPFLVRGGAALVEGRGELVTPVAPGDFWAVLINPGLQVSTAEAYEAWDNRHPS
jgi:4-diphosphocytidyl-2-C-methyl-D-erythritol kinase